MASERYPGLPEAEHGAMRLAAMLGVDTAPCRLAARAQIASVPDEMLAFGDKVLVVDRFDRGADGRRIHIEDFGQIIGAIGERKYTMGTTETVLNMVRRFSTDPRGDLQEAIRRVVTDVLLGNGDNHLKNWSFRFPEPCQIRLSPAYDIVPTVLFRPGDKLALRFVGTHDFAIVNRHRFERLAKFLQVDAKWITACVRETIERALTLWPDAAPELLGEPWGGACWNVSTPWSWSANFAGKLFGVSAGSRPCAHDGLVFATQAANAFETLEVASVRQLMQRALRRGRFQRQSLCTAIFANGGAGKARDESAHAVCCPCSDAHGGACRLAARRPQRD